MSARLRHVDPGRPPGWLSRTYAALVNTRLGRFLSINVVWRVDPYLMRATVVVDDAERQRLWALADRVFAPYAAYRREAAKANRTIPIVQLVPRD
jgi:hypothetical protein